MKENSKRIAKNTLFLYFRMLIIMLVSLYTSRIVLEALGVSDYGIYQTVGGLVVMLSFLNSALSTGSSRFLTFELGRGVSEKLRRTFSTLLLAHVALAVLMVVVGEPLGCWFIGHHLVLPQDRVRAAYIVFHLSVLTSMMTITQVPYTSVIIAHENLSIYAYVSIVESVMKLAVSFAIRYAPARRLELYALLLCMVQLVVILFYRIFCIRRYEESRLELRYIDASVLREVGSFSAWSLFASVAIPLTNQGILVLLNNFFSAAVVSARSVALLVNNAANQFISNFRTASNPQIVKRYSSGDFDGSKRLLLKSTCLSFYLMLILALPIYLLAEPLLHIWLGTVPEYSAFFLRWCMVQSLFSVFDVSFYTALYAKGRLRENALLSPTVGFVQFPVIYLFFKAGFPPEVLAYANTAGTAIVGCVVKPILLRVICGYRIGEVLVVMVRCFIVMLLSVPLPLFIARFLVDIHTFFGFLCIGSVSVLVTGIVVLAVGIGKDARRAIGKGIVVRFKDKAWTKAGRM